MCERSFVPLEGLDYFFAIGRSYVVRNEGLGSQLADADLMRCGQGMAWGDHEDQFVQVDDGGAQLGLLGIVGEDSEFGAVAQDVVGDVAAERAAHGDSDHGMQAAEFGEHGKQIERGEFVGGDGQFAFLQLSQFDQGFLGVPAQVQ